MSPKMYVLQVDRLKKITGGCIRSWVLLAGWFTLKRKRFLRTCPVNVVVETCPVNVVVDIRRPSCRCQADAEACWWLTGRGARTYVLDPDTRMHLERVLVAATTYVSEILVQFTCMYLKSSYGTVWIRAGLPMGWMPFHDFGLRAWRRADFGLSVSRKADRIVYWIWYNQVDDYFRVFFRCV